MKTHTRRALIALATVAMLALGASTADASRLQRQVDHVIASSAPGARQIAPNQVRWPRDGVTLTIPRPGAATAAAYAQCPRQYACLWQDVHGLGRRVQFFHYGTYNLAAYGMPRFTHRGASSYYNHQTGGAKAILHADFDFSMRSYGSLYGGLNDRGKSITLRP